MMAERRDARKHHHQYEHSSNSHVSEAPRRKKRNPPPAHLIQDELPQSRGVRIDPDGMPPELRDDRSDSSSSYIDISRFYHPRRGVNAIAAFFSAPSEHKRRRRRRKPRGIFRFGNSSSSSINSDLAYGTGYIRRRKSGRYDDARRENEKKKRGRREEQDPDARILEIGAGLAEIARKQNEHDLKAARHSGIFPVKREDSGRIKGINSTRGAGPSHAEHEADDEGWESASDDESEASLDSLLAYGGGEPHQASRWPWSRNPPRRKSSVVDPQLFGRQNSLHGVITRPVGFEEIDVDLSDFTPPTAPPIGRTEGRSESKNEPRFRKESVSSSASLKQVYPRATSDPNRFDATSSVVSAQDPRISTSRPDPVPLQYPKPILPPARSILEEDAYSTGADPAASNSVGPLQKRTSSLAGAALAGVAGAAIGAALVSERKVERERVKERRDPRERYRDVRDDRYDRDHDSHGEQQRKGVPQDAYGDSRAANQDRDDLDEQQVRRGQDGRKSPARDHAYIRQNENLISPDRPCGKIDPFQFQVPDDAFTTPTDSRLPIHVPEIQRGRTPEVVTVERVPHFARPSDPATNVEVNTASDERISGVDREEEERGRPRETREDRERHQTEQHAEAIYDETEHFTAPIEIGAIGAAVAAVTVAESRTQNQRTFKKGKRQGHDSKSEKERDLIQEEADRVYREAILARKIASSHEKESETAIPRIVTPPGMEEHKKKGPYDAPNADFELDHVMDPIQLQVFTPFRTGPYPSDGDFFTSGQQQSFDPSMLGLSRPLLNLVRPTPVPTPAPELQAVSEDKTKQSTVEDSNKTVSEPANLPEEAEEQVKSTANGTKSVSWGANQHYEAHEHSDHTDKPIEGTDHVRDKVEAAASPVQKKPSRWGAIRGAFMSGGAGVGTEIAAEVVSPARVDSDTKVNPIMTNIGTPESHIGSVVPEETEKEEAPPPIGPKPSMAEPSQVPGAFNEDPVFIASVAAGLKDSGYDPDMVINNQDFYKRSSPPGSEEESKIAADDDDWTSFSLSRKERKKREKARKSLESILKDAEPSETVAQINEIHEEPESYGEPPRSKKDKKKQKGQKASSGFDADDGYDTSERKISVPVNAFDDIQVEERSEPADDFDVPRKKKKKSKRDSERFYSPPEEPSVSEIDPRAVQLPPSSNVSQVSSNGKKPQMLSGLDDETRDSNDQDFMSGGTPRYGDAMEATEATYDDFEEPKKKSKKEKRRSKNDKAAFVGVSAASNDTEAGGGHPVDESHLQDAGDIDNGFMNGSKHDSFLDNAGTLGAGVGVVGAAMALTALHQQSEAEDAGIRELQHQPQRAESPHDDMQKSSRDAGIDPEISEYHFRPSIDPQYGDLLPLPPSGPGSPYTEPPADLPSLPDSQPGSPGATKAEHFTPRERISRRNEIQTPIKTPSKSAVPIKFIMGHRSTPSSPAALRLASPAASPSTDSPEITLSSRPRPRPTSWDSTKEYQPLFLLNQSRRSSAVMSSDNIESPLTSQSQEVAPAGNLELHQNDITSLSEPPSSEHEADAELLRLPPLPIGLPHTPDMLYDFPASISPITRTIEDDHCCNLVSLPALPESQSASPALQQDLPAPISRDMMSDINKPAGPKSLSSSEFLGDYVASPVQEALPPSVSPVTRIADTIGSEALTLPPLPESQSASPSTQQDLSALTAPSIGFDNENEPESLLPSSLRESVAATPASQQDQSAPISIDLELTRLPPPVESRSASPDIWSDHIVQVSATPPGEFIEARVSEALNPSQPSAHFHDNEGNETQRNVTPEEILPPQPVEPDTRDRDSYLFLSSPPGKQFSVSTFDRFNDPEDPGAGDHVEETSPTIARAAAHDIESTSALHPSPVESENAHTVEKKISQVDDVLPGLTPEIEQDRKPGHPVEVLNDVQNTIVPPYQEIKSVLESDPQFASKTDLEESGPGPELGDEYVLMTGKKSKKGKRARKEALRLAREIALAPEPTEVPSPTSRDTFNESVDSQGVIRSAGGAQGLEEGDAKAEDSEPTVAREPSTASSREIEPSEDLQAKILRGTDAEGDEKGDLVPTRESDSKPLTKKELRKMKKNKTRSAQIADDTTGTDFEAVSEFSTQEPQDTGREDHIIPDVSLPESLQAATHVSDLASSEEAYPVQADIREIQAPAVEDDFLEPNIGKKKKKKKGKALFQALESEVPTSSSEPATDSLSGVDSGITSIASGRKGKKGKNKFQAWDLEEPAQAFNAPEQLSKRLADIPTEIDIRAPETTAAENVNDALISDNTTAPEIEMAADSATNQLLQRPSPGQETPIDIISDIYVTQASDSNDLSTNIEKGTQSPSSPDPVEVKADDFIAKDHPGTPQPTQALQTYRSEDMSKDQILLASVPLHSEHVTETVSKECSPGYYPSSPTLHRPSREKFHSAETSTSYFPSDPLLQTVEVLSGSVHSAMIVAGSTFRALIQDPGKEGIEAEDNQNVNPRVVEPVEIKSQSISDEEAFNRDSAEKPGTPAEAERLATGYTHDQLEAARQAQSEFSAGKKAKKSRKGRKGVSPTVVEDDWPEDSQAVSSSYENIVPSSQDDNMEKIDGIQPKSNNGLAAGYNEDQVTLAKQLQAEFGSNNGKKSKKRNKIRSTPQTPAGEDDSSASYFDSPQPLDTRECGEAEIIDQDEKNKLSSSETTGGFASGYNIDQLELARQLKEEFGSKIKKSKKSKRRGLLQSTTEDTMLASGIEDEDKSSPSTEVDAMDDPQVSLPPEKAIDSREDMFPGSKKVKGSKKKRGSILRSTSYADDTVADIARDSSRDPDPLKRTSKTARPQSGDAASDTLDAEPEDGFTSKKSKGKGKGRKNVSKTVSDDTIAPKEPVAISSEHQQELKNKELEPTQELPWEMEPLDLKQSQNLISSIAQPALMDAARLSWADEVEEAEPNPVERGDHHEGPLSTIMDSGKGEKGPELQLDQSIGKKEVTPETTNDPSIQAHEMMPEVAAVDRSIHDVKDIEAVDASAHDRPVANASDVATRIAIPDDVVSPKATIASVVDESTKATISEGFTEYAEPSVSTENTKKTHGLLGNWDFSSLPIEESNQTNEETSRLEDRSPEADSILEDHADVAPEDSRAQEPILNKSEIQGSPEEEVQVKSFHSSDTSFDKQWNDVPEEFFRTPSKKGKKAKKNGKTKRLVPWDTPPEDHLSLEEPYRQESEAVLEDEKTSPILESIENDLNIEALDTSSLENKTIDIETRSSTAEPATAYSKHETMKKKILEPHSPGDIGPRDLDWTRSSQLPVVPEEEVAEYPERPQPLEGRPQQGRDDSNRDSAFVSESPVPPSRTFADDHEYSRDSGVHLGEGSPSQEHHNVGAADEALARLSWPPVNDNAETIDLGQSARSILEQPNTSHKAVGRQSPSLGTETLRGYDERDKRIGSPHIDRLTPDLVRQHTPEAGRTRPGSVNSTRSSGTTPPLRRTDRKLSGDLRSLSQRSQPNLAKIAKEAERSPASSIINDSTPIANESRVRVKDMADVYDGFGEGRIGSPMSPTRPASMRRRQSLQVLDLEARVDQLMAENRMLAAARVEAENNYHSSQRAAEALANRDAEINGLKESLSWLQNEVSRLKEVNEDLRHTNREITDEHNQRYSLLESQHASTARDLDEARQVHGSLSADVAATVQSEVDIAIQEKDREIQQLRDELEATREKIRDMQRQLLEAREADAEFLLVRDEDYFDSACQQLCHHVQQWVLRFSKFSDMRACRLTREINDEKTVDRLDNAVLDGSDVDDYLADRVKRRDIFMSMTMTMIWEYVFTRYLFGMDREQRQKLKSLEKMLTEVGPPKAVHQWRATTLTLLSKRGTFQQQRLQDTEAVVQLVFQTLSSILPPPSHTEDQLQEQLRKVMKVAVDLSVEMRTQRAEYMMLPPLQPEYDANGDLAQQVSFNASLMNERSGDTISNEDLQAQQAIVRVVLFPLVVKKGDDNGDGDEEIVVCPAQVLVAKARNPARIFSNDGSTMHNHSHVSMQSAMPVEHEHEQANDI